MVSHQCGFFHGSLNNWVRLNFFSHLEKLNGFSLVWILSCFLRLLESLNALLHFEQLKGFSPVWILSLVFKWPAWLNVLSHFEQLNGFSPVWVLSWAFKLPASVNFLSQFEQLNGFSVGFLKGEISRNSSDVLASMVKIELTFKIHWMCCSQLETKHTAN